jgi:DNA-binding FadR family transcriptional regulator
MPRPLTPGLVAPLGPRRARSLTRTLVDRITARIVAQELRPGDKLPTEAEIMGEYGVSRTVVREAISRLQAAGLVESRHGVGTFVLAAAAQGPFRIDPEEVATLADVIALLELRIAIEAEAASLAAARHSEAQLGEMRRALDAFDRGIDAPDEAVDADFQFHFQIAQATGNRYFVDLMSHLGTVIIPRTRLNTARFAQEERSIYLERVAREHESIWEAIARGDGDAARAAMRIHLSNSRERLRRAHEMLAA